MFREGENVLKVIARKGKTTVTDEIIQVYQTEKWGAPAKMVLRKTAQEGDLATLEVKLIDAKNVQCLDARQQVTFGLTGDGKLIDNLGTSSGSRSVELYNGRAVIRVNLNGGYSTASVKMKGLPTAFCELIH